MVMANLYIIVRFVDHTEGPRWVFDALIFKKTCMYINIAGVGCATHSGLVQDQGGPA